MGGMPGIIAKVPINKRIDLLSNPTTFGSHREFERARDAFLADLQSFDPNNKGQDYVEILKKHGIVIGKKEEAHLRNHWFNEDGQSGWWTRPEYGPIAEIHRLGLIEAFLMSKAENKPIDSYWICTGNRFQVCIGWSEQQITRIIISPGVPMHEPPDQLSQVMPIVVVKYGTRANDEISVSRDKGTNKLVDAKGQEIRLNVPRHFSPSEKVLEEQDRIISVVGRTFTYTPPSIMAASI